MMVIRLLLVALLFFPIMSNAQDQDYDQTILVMQTENYTPYPLDNLSADCDWAIPFLNREVWRGATYELRAISTNKKTGAFTKNRYMVGSMRACWTDSGEEMEDNVFETAATQEVVFTIEVNGKTYGALGNIKIAGVGPLEGTPIFSFSSILVDIVNEQPGDPVGAMTINMLQNETSIEDYGDSLNGIVTMRIFEPADEGTDTLAEILGIGQ